MNKDKFIGLLIVLICILCIVHVWNYSALKRTIYNQQRLAEVTQQAHEQQMETLAMICVVETLKYTQQRDEGNFGGLTQIQRAQLLRQNIEAQFNVNRRDGSEFHFSK